MPAFDRAVLHAASRAVFGEKIGVRSTLRAVREWLFPGLIGGLTLGRLDMARSFNMPVATLERQRGRAARRRRAALASRTRGTAVWLTFACANIMAIALVSSVIILSMLAPTAAEMAPVDTYDDELFDSMAELFRWDLRDALHFIFAVCLVEPFYVTAGFALYLNRRTILEGWDIELQLRRLESRLRPVASAALLVIALAFGGTAFAPDLHAQDAVVEAPKSAQQEIQEVLKAPEFGSDREVKRWKYVGDLEENKPEAGKPWRPPEFLANLVLFFADISQGLLWVLAAAVAAWILYALYRHWPGREPRAPRYRPPDTLFGLNVAPESLPDDVAAAALTAARAGNAREALSLLYRGALSALVHRYEVALQAGDTEGDCVRAATTCLPEDGSRYFRQLVAAWQGVAYAARSPVPASIEALCTGWPRHFAREARP